MQDTVVGIDLGTTNSVIGAVVDGLPTLFSDREGDLLASVVGTDAKGSVLVGRAAKNLRLVNPLGTVASVKRLMGQDTRVRVGTKDLSPSQVSSLILTALLDRAATQLGKRPERAVITVPAYFNDVQRQATKDAGEMAGLVVERLVNEPTAAAMTYQSGGEERVLVYDLGGGTFDVSILDRDEGFLEVKASRGDTHLGGDDIDQALCRLVLERLGDDKRKAIEGDLRAMTRLVEAVERAKIALSTREDVRLFDPFVVGEGTDAVHLDLELTRADVEQVSLPFVDRTLKCIDEALRDAKMRGSELDRVLLVGGSSKMPLIARMVSSHLGMPAQVDGNADRAVALGASMLAGRIAGADIKEVLVDITPHTLSCGALDYRMGPMMGEEDLAASAIIPRDTVVPVERRRTFYTVVEDQVGIDTPIVQGEGPRVGDNTPLGRISIENLPPSPEHSPIDVCFRLDLSGVLHVTATHLPSGCAATVTITDSPARLTEQRREAARRELESMRAKAPEQEVLPNQAMESELQLARALVTRAKRALEVEHPGDDDAKRTVTEVLDRLTGAIETRSVETSTLTDALSDALLDL